MKQTQVREKGEFVGGGLGVTKIPLPRIKKLLGMYYRVKPALCTRRAVIYTDVFKETEGKPIILKRAEAFKRYCETKKVFIQPYELIVGDPGDSPRDGIICPEHEASWLEEELDTISTRLQDPYQITEEQKEELRGHVFPYWRGKTTYDYWMSRIPEETKEIASKTGIIDVEIKTQSGPGEIAPYYEMLLKKGFKGIIREAEEKLKPLTSPLDMEKKEFYEAVILSCQGIITFAKRHAELARKMAAEEGDSERKAELEEIAEICDWVPENPARTFWEALQGLWFAQVGCQMEANAPSYSPGRIDQYLFPYYKRDIEEGRLTKDKALELIDCMYIKFADCTWLLSKNAVMYFAGYQPYQNMCVGGITPEGRDATNELSYLFIQAKEDVRLHSPSLSVRLHKQTPEEFLLKVCELVRMGTGFPAIHNDDVAIKMILLKGTSVEDARNYSLVGCVEPYAPGKMSQWTDGGHYNFAESVEFALTSGRSLIHNRQLGPKTGDPRKMSFDEFKEATKKHLAYFIKHIAVACYITEKLHAELTPYPYISSLIDNCLEKGKDITVGGARYTVGPAFIGTGTADYADSLSAIRKFVYEDKIISMDMLIDAISKNFEGYEDLRMQLWNQTSMYGNDIEEVDESAREMTDFAYQEIKKYTSFRGTPYISGLYPVASHVPHGLVVGALPYGRLATLPLADGCSPKGGTDRKGPTAVLKSVSHINHEVHVGGTLLNMKLDPLTVAGDEGLKRLAVLLRTFVDLDIYHIQFNVVSEKVLRDAQKRPEMYRSLIVRVAGYSAYFVELCRDIQEDIIQRTIHAM